MTEAEATKKAEDIIFADWIKRKLNVLTFFIKK
jgi:hypothetical protein